MKTKDLSKLPEGAILLVVKNSNGTFSPLGIKPRPRANYNGFYREIKRRTAVSSSQRNRVNNQIIKAIC